MSEFRSELLQMPHGAEACEQGQLPHKTCTSERPRSERICSSWWLWEPSLDSTLWTIVYVLRSEK